MRARLARPRRIARGRLVAPVAAAAAVALVGGVVVATPDAPTVRSEIQTVAVAGPSFNAGAAYSFDAGALVQSSQSAGFVVEDVTGLPDGMNYDGNGGVSGTATQPGVYTVQVNGRGIGGAISIPVTLTVNNPDGSAPSEATGAATFGVGVGGEARADGAAQAGGQLTTGSDGTDAILGAVTGIVTALGGDAGSVAEFATGSTGQGGVTPENQGSPAAPSGPLGSATNGEFGLGSLSNGTPETSDVPDTENPDNSDNQDNGSLGTTGSTGGGETTGEVTGGLDTQSLGPLAPLGSLIDSEVQTGSTPGGDTGTTGSTTTGGTQTGAETGAGGDLTGGGEITVPGSSFPADTGSLGALAPGLALTGAALLGIAGLSLVLNGGSSMPGSTAILPALPGSTTTGGTTTGGSSDTRNGGSSGSSDTHNGGSSGSVAPTVAAGAPSTVQAPGPSVANGRG